MAEAQKIFSNLANIKWLERGNSLISHPFDPHLTFWNSLKLCRNVVKNLLLSGHLPAHEPVPFVKNVCVLLSSSLALRRAVNHLTKCICFRHEIGLKELKPLSICNDFQLVLKFHFLEH